MDNLSLLTKQANIQMEIARIVSEYVVNNQEVLTALSDVRFRKEVNADGRKNETPPQKIELIFRFCYNASKFLLLR